MPEKETMRRVHRDQAQGKSASTQAGEFVREEMHHIREGKHGARSAKQAIAIGLSKARRAGVKLGLPRQGSAKARRQAALDSRAAKSHHSASRTRSRATLSALKREGGSAASHLALSRHAHSAARARGASDLRRSAREAAQTRGRR
jgi:hypothetical protein